MLAHNLETVPRIFKRIRPAFRFDRSLDVIRAARDFGLVTKSNLILGMGETSEEIVDAMRDLHSAGCDILTITQYLRPSPLHHPIDRWVKPQEFVELSEQARESGDVQKATEYENAAEAFAAQLVTAEQNVEDLKGLHDQSLQAAGQAKKAVEQNAMVLQQKVAERTKLLSQLEQAKMQEQVSASLQSMSDVSAGGNTPNLDQVRDKIETRYANALGSAELAQNSVQGRMMEVQQASTQMAGHSRLEQIRASMKSGGDQLGQGTGSAGQLSEGQAKPATPNQQGQAQPEQQ